MKILLGTRGCGKTTKLVKVSANENKVIVCSTEQGAKIIEDTARKLNLNIPKPITIHNFRDKFRGNKIIDRGILIDDFDNVLEQIFRVPIDYMTSSIKVRK